MSDIPEITNNNDSIKINGMYQDWFLDYASYVILERAVPSVVDGFKPVHRRILHAMKDLDDGRYNKVANIVGHTMQYHPHGDASISESYDGRKKEPVNLPVKFPMVLAQGAEGIAVGLSTKILPHNFNELIEASIKHLEGKKFKLFPDFPTAGIIDVSAYNDGLRGGKVRIRAKISARDKNTLVISEIPYSTNTTSLIESILKANDKGKIKIKKIEDNTSSSVEILVHIPSSISPDKTIDALYAFTNCEVSISPLSCVIIDDKPHFLGVSELLKISTHHTVDLLKAELEIKLSELENQWHFLSLEKIFIENRIYRDIEEEETWEGVIQAIDRGLKPFIKHLKRQVTEDDITRLTEIKIKRISKFDLDKAQQKIEALEGEIEQVKYNLANLITFAIDYFKNLKSKYGKGRERQSEIRLFEDIEASKVVIRNTKLYVNRKEGFIGTSLKKEEYVTDCSDIDDIICFTESGLMMVTKVDTKNFIGKNIIYTNIFKRKDKRTIYNIIYRDGKTGHNFMKRFSVTSITRDRAYNITQGKAGSKVLYFSANPNGEAEVVNIQLRQKKGLKKLKFDLDFKDLAIKGRGVKGNLVTKLPIKRAELKEEGVSTLKPRKIWFDDTVRRLNTDERGELLGAFKGNDRLLIVRQNGIVKTIIPEITTHFENDVIVLEKWQPKKPISLIYWEGEKQRYYLKRFLIEQTDKEEQVITDHPDSQLELISTDYRPQIEIEFIKQKGKDRKPNQIINAEEFIAIKGIKAQGNQLTADKVKQINALEPLKHELDDMESKDFNDESENNSSHESQASLF